MRASRAIAQRRLQSGELFLHPVEASEGSESFDEMLVDREQKLDVFEGIVDLLLGQRPLAPVGVGVGFVQLLAGDFLHQLPVGRLEAVPDHGRRQLRVEER